MTKKGKKQQLFVDVVARISSVAVKTAPLSAQHKFVTLAHKGYPVLELDSGPHAATPIQSTCLSSGLSDQRHFLTRNTTSLFICHNFGFGRTKANGATSDLFCESFPLGCQT